MCPSPSLRQIMSLPPGARFFSSLLGRWRLWRNGDGEYVPFILISRRRRWGRPRPATATERARMKGAPRILFSPRGASVGLRTASFSSEAEALARSDACNSGGGRKILRTFGFHGRGRCSACSDLPMKQTSKRGAACKGFLL